MEEQREGDEQEVRWMSFILPVTGTQQVQEHQDRCRTFRGITRTIRSSSWTTLKRVLEVFKGCLHLCWNFEPFVSALKGSYRDELKTHSRHVLGAHVGSKTT